MTHTRRQLDQLLDNALDLPTEALPAFLANQCPSELRPRLSALLEVRDEESETELQERSPFSGEIFQQLAGRLAEPEQLAKGDCVGSWRVTGSLGQGGMGSVYRAQATEEEGVEVALKVMRACGESITEHHELEREILATLDHQNIVRLRGEGTHDDGRSYLVLELVEGGQHIDKHCDDRQLSVEQRLRLFMSLARAVQAVHQQGIVHRDLKPSNVLVTADGEVKLIDFGIAKWIGPEPAAELVHPDMVVEAMTPDCASPEQFLGRPITEATDVYQLGVLLYQLLTGERPYELKGRHPASIKQVVCEQQPSEPSSLYTGTAAWDKAKVERARRRRASVPALSRSLRGELDTIVLKALRKDPSRRYRNVGELLDALECYFGEAGMPLGRAA